MSDVPMIPDPPARPVSRDVFEIAHQMLRHEDTLVSNRLGWLFSIQTLLFAAMGAMLALTAKEKSIPVLVHGFAGSVVFIGLTVPLVIRNLVKKAQARKRVIDGYWAAHRAAGDPEKLRDDTPNPTWALVANVPLYFAGGWLVTAAVWIVAATQVARG